MNYSKLLKTLIQRQTEIRTIRADLNYEEERIFKLRKIIEKKYEKSEKNHLHSGPVRYNSYNK